jgi:glyoxylase-like metal-dependent hydrolase (beta-lactamase superfamily II)
VSGTSTASGIAAVVVWLRMGIPSVARCRAVSSDGDIELTVRDLGPGESPHDSIWFLGEDKGNVFSGDLAYNHMHCYLADGFWQQRLAAIEALSADLPADVVLRPGHGEIAGLDLLAWQRRQSLVVVANRAGRSSSCPGTHRTRRRLQSNAAISI